MAISILSAGARTPVMAVTPVAITIDAARPGPAIPPDYFGLSFESELLLPDKTGRHYFSPDNKPLAALFRTLGIKNLRIGGNTSDNPVVRIPGPRDADSLFAFARTVGVKVIYGLRLRGQADGQNVVPIAKYISDHYSDALECFAIGNEPSIYYKQYEIYRGHWNRLMAEITASDVAPDALFCGPNDFSGEFIQRFADDFRDSGRLKSVVEHAYVGLNAQDVKDPAAARDRILSPEFAGTYEAFYKTFAPHVMSRNLPYRMEETNSFYNGGAKDVSDTFAACLWGLEYLHWWAAHGAAGLNYHTGDHVAAGDKSTPCRYAVFWSAPAGYEVHPLGYAAKAFDLGGHGTCLPTNVESGEKLNLRAFAVLAADGSIDVTVINKEHGPSGRDANIALNAGKLYTSGRAVYVTAPNGDVAAKSGVTVGGAAIETDGSWNGNWTALAAPAAGGEFRLRVPAASAAVIQLGVKQFAATGAEFVK